MPNILVIYEEVPEATYIATLAVSVEQLERYKTLAGTVVNFQRPIDMANPDAGKRDLTQAEIDLNLELAELVKAAKRDSNATGGGVFDAIIFTGFGL
ncbi:MAG: hypothetical protein WAV09_03070 [Minisyncoccia bacterium]